MKELKISVIYGGSCPPQADPSMYNPDNYQANLQYFHDFLQRRGSSANTIDSYFTVCTVMLPWRISSLTKHGLWNATNPAQ